MPSLSLRALASLFLMIVFAMTARAETAAERYRASVPVTEQGAAELKRAAGVGLAEVLTRVSGQAAIANEPGPRAAIADAERYVDQYRYERQPDGALVLQLQFAPSAVDALLRSRAPTQSAGAGNAAALQLRVVGIENFADYSALLGYLGGLNGVRAQPQAVDAGGVTLALQTPAGADSLAQQLAADRRLLPESAADAGVLVYRWQRVAIAQ